MRYNFIGVDVDVITYKELFAKCEQWLQDKSARSKHVACVNVNCVVESYLNREIKEIFTKADISGPDSMPFVYWIRLITGQKCDRLYAPDIILNLCRIAVQRGYRLYLYGGAEGVPETMQQFLQSKFPGLQIVGTYSPPFRPLTLQEDALVCEQIRQANPDFIIVGLGSPKQDQWIQDHLSKIPGTIMIASGAAFDFFSNRIPQAPYWIQRSGFEWLFRLTQDPKRLWKRYTVYNFVFIWNFLLQLLRLKRFDSIRVPQNN
ncbi:WecB/TagA/CpsF family glycosyltransferase [Leptolyngbya sp. NK1-12]|uniref:WecB/TagA/CpsF family glycosyltransferase n=1 Tax=Leptolyngbya sp. NK1-12 TaxID=2547451 RepID=A0AA96WMU3_9CYAN|nr:WecB/TagA/CpsF family glycosyltransferase [Leptolyngbya sp. NK1-12]WNZ24386.1 WecB/TagA/CpsF family glycosyltransferase [Leptolyngbya sp. NK1-12]